MRERGLGDDLFPTPIEKKKKKGKESRASLVVLY